MEVVINRCYGGFGLSHKATMLYAKKKGFPLYAVVEKGKFTIRNQVFRYYDPENDEVPFVLFYVKKPLREDGTWDEESFFSDSDIERNDPVLVQVVKELKHEANGGFSDLAIVDVPDDVSWDIAEYDGMESVEEKHRSWW